MRYLPHTEAEIREMLTRIGVSSIDELFEPVPATNRLQGGLDLEPALDEPRLMRHLGELAASNEGAQMLSFLGGGMYRHHIPPAVDQLLQRSEFYTAYTPYQAELSQGTLQGIFEFQTTVCELFGVEVANASLYDGASAAAEAILMARRIKRRSNVVVSEGLHPDYLATIRAYTRGLDAESTISLSPLDRNGQTDWDAAAKLVSDQTAALVVGYPNVLGCVEDLEAAKRVAETADALLITATAEPYALSLVRPPGDFGVEICVGEGQPLAVPPQFGGPGVGLFGCAQRFVRQMPGRLVGQTLDADGQPGFVLTLSTREQHIRRERATSNICTNHGLIALAFAMRTAMLGQRGFLEAGQRCLEGAHYLRQQIAAIGGLSLPYDAPFFNEFVVRCAHAPASDVVRSVAADGILAGLDLGRFRDEWKHDLAIAVTEVHGRADLDRLIASLTSVAANFQNH